MLSPEEGQIIRVGRQKGKEKGKTWQTSLQPSCTKKKSQLTPCQQVNYVGKKFYLMDRMVGSQPPKTEQGLGMTKAYLRGRKSSPANNAVMAWTMLDLQKGNLAQHVLRLGVFFVL